MKCKIWRVIFLKSFLPPKIRWISGFPRIMDTWSAHRDEMNSNICARALLSTSSTAPRLFSRPILAIGPELSISRQKFRITGSRVRMEARFFSNLNGASLHSAFHVHLSIVLIWLTYCWKGRKTATNPWITGNLLFSVSHVYPLQ